MPFPETPCAICPREAHGWPPPCPAQIHPERGWCRYAADWADAVVVYFLCGIGPEPGTPPAIPLAGDLVATATRMIGADRLARWVAVHMGYNDCGCADRQQWLNEKDAALRRYLGLTVSPGSPVEPR